MSTQLRDVMQGNDLNRRVEVEIELLQMHKGEKPLPSAADCKRMALRLGVPEIWKESQLGAAPTAQPAAPTSSPLSGGTTLAVANPPDGDRSEM